MPGRFPHPNAQSWSKNLVMAGVPQARLVFAFLSSPFGAGLNGSPCTIPSPGMQTPGSMHAAPSFHERFCLMLLVMGLSRSA